MYVKDYCGNIPIVGGGVSPIVVVDCKGWACPWNLDQYCCVVVVQTFVVTC